MLVAIITHPQDQRLQTGLGGYLQKSRHFYQLDPVLLAARWLGLRWFFTDPGQPFRPADAAFLHVDMSLIPQDYLDLAARYPKTVNGKVSDIRKRHVSRNLLDRGADWSGPVLVKSDLNSRGTPELSRAERLTRPEGRGALKEKAPEYQVFDHIGAVPASVWQDKTRVVEKFLPERRGDHNVLRIWNFLGSYERCSWYASPETIIKGNSIAQFGPSEVPDEIRAERKRLGFDYGKFDFAIGPEGPVLFDANRTPACLFSRPDLMNEAAVPSARALIRMIKG